MKVDLVEFRTHLVNQLVDEGFIKNCIGTDDEDEDEVSNIIDAMMQKFFKFNEVSDLLEVVPQAKSEVMEKILEMMLMGKTVGYKDEDNVKYKCFIDRINSDTTVHLTCIETGDEFEEVDVEELRF